MSLFFYIDECAEEFVRVEFNDQPALVSQATSMGSFGQVRVLSPSLNSTYNLPNDASSSSLAGQSVWA